jgi:hypothetical protein
MHRRALQEKDLKEAAAKPKRPRPSQPLNLAALSGQSGISAVSSVHWGQEFKTDADRTKFLNSEEFLCAALLENAKSALQKHTESVARNVGNILSLWRACELAAVEFRNSFHAQTVHKCAKRLETDPGFCPSSVRGGTWTCAKNPAFVAFLIEELRTRDVAGQNALAGKALEDWIGQRCQSIVV